MGQKLYYYYPDQNVYFNANEHEYLYQKNGRWYQDKVLPSIFHVNRHDRVYIICGNTNVLDDSSFHKQIARNWENRGRKVTDTTQYIIRIDHDRS
jgi:hypothetical protein